MVRRRCYKKLDQDKDIIYKINCLMCEMNRMLFTD